MREGPGYQFHRSSFKNSLTFQTWRERGTSKEINVFSINFKPFLTYCSLISNTEWDINLSPNRESNSSNDDIVKNKVWKCPIGGTSAATVLSHPSDLGMVARGIELSLHRSALLFCFSCPLAALCACRSVWKPEVGVLHSTATVSIHSPVFDRNRGRNRGTVIRGSGGKGACVFLPSRIIYPAPALSVLLSSTSSSFEIPWAISLQFQVYSYRPEHARAPPSH